MLISPDVSRSKILKPKDAGPNIDPAKLMGLNPSPMEPEYEITYYCTIIKKIVSLFLRNYYVFLFIVP